MYQILLSLPARPDPAPAKCRRQLHQTTLHRARARAQESHRTLYMRKLRHPRHGRSFHGSTAKAREQCLSRRLSALTVIPRHHPLLYARPVARRDPNALIHPRLSSQERPLSHPSSGESLYLEAVHRQSLDTESPKCDDRLWRLKSRLHCEHRACAARLCRMNLRSDCRLSHTTIQKPKKTTMVTFGRAQPVSHPYQITSRERTPQTRLAGLIEATSCPAHRLPSSLE
jgi:hypothetical protein